MEDDPDAVEQNEEPGSAEEDQDPAESDDLPSYEDDETGESSELEQAESEEQPEEPKEPLKVFISYKRDCGDQDIAARLYKDLSTKNYDVFLDTQRPQIGEFGEDAATFLDQTDYVVVLLSANYVAEAEYGMAELERVSKRYRREKRPTIIPVRLDSSQLSLDVSSYVRRFNAIFWNQDYWELLERLECALNNRLPPSNKPSAIGLDPFLIGKSRRDRIKSTFVEPSGWSLNGNLGDSKKVLWLVGDTEVRNYLAVSLATRQNTKAVYEISKAKSWLEIYNSGITESTIILRDVSPARHFSEDSAGDELSSLASLIERKNVLIATISKEAFSQAQQEMTKYDFKHSAPIEVDPGWYNKSAKTRIFTNLLDYSYKSGDISDEQHKWARSLISNGATDQLQSQNTGLPNNKVLIEDSQTKFQEVLERWSPPDIERFVRLSLHQIKQYSDILKFLQRNAALDDEIRSWFVSLEDSTRCFILVLAIFYELDNEDFWRKYKAAVQHLQKIAPHLSSLNLGIGRQYAAPYVSTEGSVDFADERIAEAISLELAKSYREYFVELIPKFKEWSVPSERQSTDKKVQAERKRKAEQTKLIRSAIARAVGKFGRLGFDDQLEIIEYWATDPLIQIKDAAAIAVEQIIQDAKAANRMLDLLEQWCEFSSNNHRMRATALCLARIAPVKPDSPISNRALDCLQVLARNKDQRIKFYVSVALQRMAREIRLEKIEPLATSVASKGTPPLRMNVANALNESRRIDDAEVASLLDRWSLSEDAKLRWTAFCCPIIQREPSHRKAVRGDDFINNRNKQLLSFLDQDAPMLANVFVEAISNDHHGKTAFACFENFVLDSSTDDKPRLVAAFSSISLDRLEPRLFERLRSSDHLNAANLLTEIRTQAWTRALSKPPEFLNLLNDKLRHDRHLRETFDTLVSLLKLEPPGCGDRVVRALASCYPQQRAMLETVLTRLHKVAEAHFEPMTRQVWQQVLKNLFSDPPAFLTFINENLTREGRYEITLLIVEAVAQSFLNEVLQALAFIYSLRPEVVKHTLHVFRGCQRPRLNRLVREFYYRLLEGDLSDHRQLVTRLSSSLKDEEERPALLGALQLLYAANPKSRKEDVIDTFVQAVDAIPLEVAELLSNPHLKEWPNLESLEREVIQAHNQKHSFLSVLRRFFNPD